MSSRRSFPSPAFRATLFSAVLSTVFLTACAPLPTTHPSPTMADIAALGTVAPSAAAAAWPADDWWARYGDAQLDTLMAEALRGAPDLAVAQARLAQAEGIAQQQGAALRPAVQATASALDTRQSRNYLTPASMLPKGWQVYGNAGLDFSWDFDFWGRNRAALAAATSQVEAARADAAQARVTLTTAIAAAWFHLDELYAERDTAAQALQVREQSRTLFQTRLDNGLENTGSLRQMDARSAQARGDLLAIDESIELQRGEIAALAGAGPDRARAIARPALTVRTGQGLPATLPAELLGRRPDLVASRLRVEATARKVDVARAGFYPNVNLSAMIGLQSLGLASFAHAGSVVGDVGPAITLPLFDQGRLKGQYASAQGAYDEAVASYDASLVRALHEVADAAASARALGPELAQAQAAVDASRDAWRVAQDRYRGGLASDLEVLVSEDTLLASQRELTRLQERGLALDVALVRALGGGFDAATMSARG